MEDDSDDDLFAESDTHNAASLFGVLHLLDAAESSAPVDELAPPFSISFSPRYLSRSLS